MNHFPGIARVVSKAALAQTLAQAAEADRETDYEFYPPTWQLPAESEAFENHARAHPDCKWIHKPASGSGGRGIAVYADYREVPRAKDSLVQRYLDDPMTIDGRKFNLRVYLLLTALEPLTAWVHRDGYVDLAGAPFVNGDDAGSDPLVFNTNTHVQTALTGRDAAQCSLSLREWLAATDDGGFALWRDIRAMLAALSTAIRLRLDESLSGYLVNPRNCFELLGVDIQVDRAGKPWLIECNRSPELAPLSSGRIKQRLIRDLFVVVSPPGPGVVRGAEDGPGFEPLEADA